MEKILLFCLMAILATACGDKETNTDYLIFGHFYGECLGETCIETFKVEDELLYEDQLDNYTAGGNVDFEFVEISQDKYEEAKDLEKVIPQSLFSKSGETFGMPDAGDWGGLYLEISREGIVYFWTLDMMKNNVDDEYHNLIDEINKTIASINQ